MQWSLLYGSYYVILYISICEFFINEMIEMKDVKNICSLFQSINPVLIQVYPHK